MNVVKLLTCMLLVMLQTGNSLGYENGHIFHDSRMF